MTAGDLRVIEGGRSSTRKNEDPQQRVVNLDLEAWLVGCCLAGPEALADVRMVVAASDFYAEAHRRVFESLCRLADAGHPIDHVTVMTDLRDAGRLEQVGGLAYLMTLSGSAVGALAGETKGHVLEYARRVRDLSVRRELRDLAREIVVRCEISEQETPVLLERFGARHAGMVQSLVSLDAGQRFDAIAAATLRAVEKATSSTATKRPKRCWGLRALDEATGGLYSELAVVGARPGIGKTSLVTAVLVSMGLAGFGGHFASLDTVRETLMLRTICARASVSIHRARVPDLTLEEWSRITTAANDLAPLPIWIDDTKGLTVKEIKSRVRRTQMALATDGRELGAVAIDYLQIVKPPRPMRRSDAVGEIATDLKAMAADLDVPVIALAQLNREAAKVARPKVSHLRDSGEIESAASTILLLSQARDGLVNVEVAKQNTGPTGSVTLAFNEVTLAFSDAPDTQSLPLTPPTLLPSATARYTCGACGSTLPVGVSCSCGRTETPLDADDGQGSFANWVDREVPR